MSKIIEGTVIPSAFYFRRVSFAMAAVVTAVLVLVSTVSGSEAWAGEELAIGESVPDFTLTDTDGKKHTLSDYTEAGFTVVLEWFNPDCPFIKKHHLNHKTMNEIYADVRELKVLWLAINSSAPGKQGHGLERNQEAKQEYEMDMAILLDEDGKVGRLYGAKTTPHMFVISTDGVLLYNGAIDDDKSRDLGEINYVANALSACLAGQPVEVTTTKPYGCSVKYAQ